MIDTSLKNTLMLNPSILKRFSKSSNFFYYGPKPNLNETEPSPRPSPSHSTPFKRSESVKSVISEQELTSRSTPIGAKSSSSTATTTKNKSDIVDEELTLPTDIMDSEFLLDDPMAGKSFFDNR